MTKREVMISEVNDMIKKLSEEWKNTIEGSKKQKDIVKALDSLWDAKIALERLHTAEKNELLSKTLNNRLKSLND